MRCYLAKVLHFLRSWTMSVENYLTPKSLKRAGSPAPEEQPLPKILVAEVEKVKVKKRMCALLMMYSGWGYFGMQRSPTHPTIEGELTKALISCGYLIDSSPEEYRKVWFQRASKTDKSVSAIGQVCSMLVSHYTGQHFFQSHRFTFSYVSNSNPFLAFPKLPENEEIKTKMNAVLPDHIRILVPPVFRTAVWAAHHRVYDYFFPTFTLAPHDLSGGDQAHWNYRVSAERLTQANEVLKRFRGTHNFYNFTSGRDATDKSCYRYIISIKCLPPALFGDHEYAVIRVIGQSFMLHQIRKMLGLMFAIVRGIATEEVFDLVFRPERVDVPKAPGLGLMLNQVVYTRYNERYGQDGIHAPIDWSKYEDDMALFRMKYVYEHIDKTEFEERSYPFTFSSCSDMMTYDMLDWLESLNMHSYYFRPPGSPVNLPPNPGESTEACVMNHPEQPKFTVPATDSETTALST
ncbi:tRNA pseudouridine synthase [Fasciola hepatica]|uniref:tRNA pseudouridine synthase n=1 Tax=Fasciola hepatica TaxID=6192 RepID=A0A4E0S0Z7_FASHE|nr:tRNA pseudouridine synthase [Fasciola hepatica]